MKSSGKKAEERKPPPPPPPPDRAGTMRDKYRSTATHTHRKFSCWTDVPLVPFPRYVNFTDGTSPPPLLPLVGREGGSLELVLRGYAAEVRCGNALRKAFGRFVGRAYSMGSGDPRTYAPMEGGPPPEAAAAAGDGGGGAGGRTIRAVVIELIEGAGAVVPGPGGPRPSPRPSRRPESRDDAAAETDGMSWTLCSSDGDVDPGLHGLGADESYDLEVGLGGGAGGAGAVRIAARTAIGALRALSTLSQLVLWTGSELGIPCAPLSISDSPRFAWRGLLIDTARHYIHPRQLKRAVDGMEVLRMNVLHWHMVDSQSFPFKSRAHPLLSREGAYDPVHGVYDHGDVRDIVRHAADRGVRVVPEFDVPGHTKSWGRGYPDIVIECPDKYGEDPSYEHAADLAALHPLKDETYGFVRDLFDEVMTLFPDRHFHLGGDELNGGCIETDPAVAEYKRKNGASWKKKLQGEFTSRVLPQVIDAGKVPIFWDESIRMPIDFPEGTIIEWWTSWASRTAVPNLARKKGLDLLTTAGWYLNDDSNWWDRYTKTILTDAMLGGEACSWAEHVSAGNFDHRAFRHLPAVAERLWSTESFVGSSGRVENRWRVERRVDGVICLLNQREGLSVGSTKPDFCPPSSRDNERTVNLRGKVVDLESTEELSQKIDFIRETTAMTTLISMLTSGGLVMYLLTVYFKRMTSRRVGG